MESKFISIGFLISKFILFSKVFLTEISRLAMSFNLNINSLIFSKNALKFISTFEFTLTSPSFTSISKDFSFNFKIFSLFKAANISSKNLLNIFEISLKSLLDDGVLSGLLFGISTLCLFASAILIAINELDKSLIASIKL